MPQCNFCKRGICQLVGRDGKKEKCPYISGREQAQRCRHYRPKS